MSEYTVLPLLNSAFKPGTAVEVVERFEDSDFRNIARAELFYFSGRAKECCEIAESYLEDRAAAFCVYTLWLFESFSW